jgi:integrase
MAYLFKQKRSPFWWIAFREGDRLVRQSTHLRSDVAAQTRQANELLSDKRRKEGTRQEAKERWEGWVRQFIEERYEESPKSLERNLARWRSLSVFLAEQKILYPSQLAFSHCLDFIRWRRAGNKPLGVYAAAKNTAIAEVKFLGLLMKQAGRLGLSTTNPCAALGIKKSKPTEKPEITEDHLSAIWKALEQEPEWTRINFAVCLYTGCRLCEARVPMDCIDLERREIRFPTAKGGRPYTAPLRAELIPLLTKLKAERTSYLFDFPDRMPAKHWWLFFKRLNLPYSMHCLRVTFITRAARAGVSERDLCRLVNHAGPLINRTYQRLRAQDVRTSLDQIPLPSFPMRASPGTPDAPRSTSSPA